MKALKYILLGFGVIILSFFSMGFMHASFTYENEVQVNSTIDHSFEIFTNDSLGPKWLIGLKGYDVIEGAPHQPGSKFLMKFESEGQSFEFVETLTDFIPNEKFVFTMETEYFDGEVSITFTESNGGTLIKSSTTNYPKGLFNKSMFYLMKGSLQAQSQMNYNNLKQLIESTLER